MTQNEIKTQIAHEAIQLSSQYPYMILQMGTGLGKTLTSVLIAEKDNALPWLIVVYETIQIDNWIADIKKHGKEDFLKNVTFTCYASLHKYKNTLWNIIFDEGHHLSPEKRLIAKTIRANRILILSASIGKMLKMNLELDLNRKFYVFKKSLSDGIELGALPEPKLLIYTLELDNVIKDEEVSFGEGKTIKVTKLGRLKMYDNYIEKLKNKFMGSTTLFNRNKWLQEATKRKNFIADCKTTTAQEIIKLFKKYNKKFIVFANTVPQAELLGTNVISSKSGKKNNSKTVEQFNNNTITELYCCKMAQEGMNFSGIEAGLLIQLDSNPRKGHQTTGRSMRAEYPIMIILVMKDTQDMIYLANFLEDFNPDFIYYVNSLEEIEELCM